MSRSSQKFVRFVRLVDSGKYLLKSEMKSRNRIESETLHRITHVSTLIHYDRVVGFDSHIRLHLILLLKIEIDELLPWQEFINLM